MSEKTQDTNRTMLYLLGVVVVLLVVIVALVVVRAQGTNQTAAVPPTTSAEAPANSAMPGVKPSTSADFDVKTATKVPSGTEPKAYVTTYYQSILDKKWDVAFKMQPAASQAGGTAKDFEQTQTGYGMKSFKIGSATVSGDTATVVAQQDLGTNGQWTVTWSFVKNGADWVVKSRAVAMGQ
jgi:hypothetical protein